MGGCIYWDPTSRAIISRRWIQYVYLFGVSSSGINHGYRSVFYEQIRNKYWNYSNQKRHPDGNILRPMLLSFLVYCCTGKSETPPICVLMVRSLHSSLRVKRCLPWITAMVLFTRGLRITLHLIWLEFICFLLSNEFSPKKIINKEWSSLCLKIKNPLASLPVKYLYESNPSLGGIYFQMKVDFDRMM